MKITRRHILATITAAAVLGASCMAQAADTVRIGLPTKTYWPTTIAETAVRQKLFEKEGITAELTIYRGGAETFEAMAAGAADVILDATSLVSAGRKKGVNSKVLANAAMGYYGWQLMTLAKSTLGVSDLKGKKVAITSAGSGSDLLALWTQQDKKIEFTRVPVGGEVRRHFLGVVEDGAGFARLGDLEAQRRVDHGRVHIAGEQVRHQAAAADGHAGEFDLLVLLGPQREQVGA